MRHPSAYICAVKYFFCLVSLGAALFLAAPAFAQAAGPAVVQHDASLLISGRRYALADIIIPTGGRTCDTSVNPPICGSPAYVALRTKIQHFVSCKLRIDLPDPDAAVCRHGPVAPAGGEDLAAYLIEQGWARPTESAPPLYHTMELLARSNARGMWGLQADDLR